MANPLFVLESVGLACETLKFLEAERNYFLKCSVGGGDVRLLNASSSQDQQNHNENEEDENVGQGDAGDGGGHSHDAVEAEIKVREEEKPSKKSKKSKDKGSKSQQQQPSCHQNEKVKNNSQGPVELPIKTSTAVAVTEEFSLSSLSQQVAKAREQILNSLINLNLNNESSTCSTTNSLTSSLSLPKIKSTSSSCSHTHTCCNTLTPKEEAMLKEENARLARQVDDLQKQVKDLVNRVSKLEVSGVSGGAAPTPKAAPSKKEESDDEDLFASDNEEESAEAERIKAERVAAYAAKKSAKPALIAKSNVILDVKPWDDETDMKQMEKLVRAIEMPGLWGASKLVPVGYGIRKLQISCVVEDDKISIEELTELIESNEEFVQSVDIAAFNKV